MPGLWSPLTAVVSGTDSYGSVSEAKQAIQSCGISTTADVLAEHVPVRAKGTRYLSFDPTDRPPGRAQREENLSRSSPTDRPSAARSAAIF